MSYLEQFSSKSTPQSEPIPGSTQVENSTGGYAWRVGDWQRLERFLILGAEGGTYYIRERPLVRENADVVLRALKEDGPRVVRTIVDISEAGRAPKNDPALFALALAISFGDDATRAFAGRLLPKVARTGTHLFQFLTFVQQHRGWGRGLRHAVEGWYHTHEAMKDLSYQLVKYRQRGGWTHRDVLRKAHPAPSGYEPYAQRLRWAAGKLDVVVDETGHVFGAPDDTIGAFEVAQRTRTPAETASLIRTYGSVLPREALQPEHLNSPHVWMALLENGMPITALIRNLATMTRVGVLAPFSEGARLVTARLEDGLALERARVHPLNLLVAMRTYASGHGDRGRNIWIPNAAIIDALDGAFYASFKYAPQTGKRYMLGLDVSGSMSVGRIAGMNITPREGSVAMAMATAAREEHMLLGFSHQLVSLNISPRQRLDDIIRTTSQIPYGGTDAALPILAAQRQGLPIDVFVIYTDNETWAGNVHPAQALRAYRQSTGIQAKLVVVAMTSNGFSIADPDDAGMLDVVGFDTTVPAVLADFATS